MGVGAPELKLICNRSKNAILGIQPTVNDLKFGNNFTFISQIKCRIIRAGIVLILFILDNNFSVMSR